MECIAGCFRSKSPRRSRRKNSRNEEPRPAQHPQIVAGQFPGQYKAHRHNKPSRIGYQHFGESEKSDTPLLSRLSDMTDESELSSESSTQGKQEFYQSCLRSGPESSSTESSSTDSYGKNGYGIPSIGVPGRAVVIRCDNQVVTRSDPGITKDIERRLKSAWNYK